ncbi:hypothetical protein PT306_00985 [Metamycoplasma hyosynoviae]|uniref:hypothetical protein n=1 Tax=Metamycoplasma hyosynoviae TaxID=29559 RepID=UPI00236215E4|nr:hypothetical protein [Metamycoplasma hyosynoviae]MDD1359238.1 hypothetical protein [Metamycoplasma hyosynoviae]MDD1377480.1 hypothetical protein [Metamycoplasma hyosynoviae]MDD1378848.1 hypothetical protein [Metamycoplasma hyosynoviae]MDD7893275.1 hypothetical protein [Metamycoplasma hyosynoviae]
MNKTTKIILSTAIPVGVASILIPTIVVASLKSKVKKTEQERKSLNDLNLEVEEYLGKITTEVKNTNIEKYTELFDLIGETKNVISNKYLKKEDYRKQLLLLKEKFDSFKETIKPPTNDTNNNSDNTNNENEKDSSQPKTDKEVNPQKENVSAYEQLKIELTKAEEFYNSIKEEKYIEIKNKIKTYLEEIKKILETNSSKEEKYLNEKNNLILKINAFKKEINQIDIKLDKEVKEELEELAGKENLFKSNLENIQNNEKYNSLYKEIQIIDEKYNINKSIAITPFEIKYKGFLLDHINDRYREVKQNIDNDSTKEILQNKITKLMNYLDSNKDSLSIFINVEDVKNVLNKYMNESNMALNANSANKINEELTNIWLVFGFSMNVYKIHQWLTSAKIPKKDNILPFKQTFDYDNKINILKVLEEKVKILKNIEGWDNNKYLKYFYAFFEIKKISLKTNFQYVELKELFEKFKKFYSLQGEIENIYNDLSIDTKSKIELNTKIRNNIREYVIPLHNTSSIDRLISDITSELQKINKNITSDIEIFEQRKNKILEKLKTYDEYDVNNVEKIFSDLKQEYQNKTSSGDNYYVLTKIEDFFFKYENIVKNIDEEIKKYNNLLKKIDAFIVEHSNEKYSFVTQNISKYINEIKTYKFLSIQDVDKINIILNSLLIASNNYVKFIDNLPDDKNILKNKIQSIKNDIQKIFVDSQTVDIYIKDSYNKFLKESEASIKNNDNINILKKYAYIFNEYKDIFIKKLTTTKNNIANSQFENYEASEYFFKLTDEYMIKEDEITKIISNLFNHFKSNAENVIDLHIINSFISQLVSLNKEYNEKIKAYDDIFKRYNTKINKLEEEINKIDKQDNPVFIETVFFIADMLEFSYKYIDNIFEKNIDDIKNMEKDLDLLIKIVSENKTLTQ